MITAGQILKARSVCDNDCIFTAEIISRAGKTAMVKSIDGTKRCKVHSDEKGEFIMPFGRYSMAPIFRPEPIKLQGAMIQVGETEL